MSKKYEALLAARDAAQSKLKGLSMKMRTLIEDEERYIKRNREQRTELEKEKSVVAVEVTTAQKALDRLESALPRSIHEAVSEREVAVNQLEFDLRGAKRDLHVAKTTLEQAEKRGIRGTDLKEFHSEATRMEERVASLEDDLDEAKKSLESVLTLKLEAIEKLAEQPVS